MSNYYYIQSELVIGYQDKDGKTCTIYTNRTIEKRHIFYWQDQDSDDDLDTANKKFTVELEREMQRNTYNKILYSNGEWVKEPYKAKYEPYLMKTYPEIVKILKVFKKKFSSEKRV
jgi:hypothetical protein